MIAGTQTRRPTTRSETYEPVTSEQELANGSTRTYYKGRRLSVSLAWGKITGDERDALRAALAAPYVTYQEDSTAPATVVSVSSAPEFDPVPGTYPIRYNAAVTLKARDLLP